MRSGSCIC